MGLGRGEHVDRQVRPQVVVGIDRLADLPFSLRKRRKAFRQQFLFENAVYPFCDGVLERVVFSLMLTRMLVPSSFMYSEL